MKCRRAPVLKLCQSPLPSHCCNSGIFRGASPRCFPYATTCLRVRQSPKGKDYVVRDTVSAKRHWEADPTTAGRGHF